MAVRSMYSDSGRALTGRAARCTFAPVLGGQPQNPVWVYNIRANPDVQIRDVTEGFKMRVREVEDDAERERLWQAGAEAYPPYNDYQAKTTRKIPVFLAEPV